MLGIYSYIVDYLTRYATTHDMRRKVGHSSLFLVSPFLLFLSVSSSLFSYLVVGDHLEKGHLRDGGEVVHADDVLRALARRGDLAHAEGGRVGSEHTMLGDDLSG